MSKRYRHLTSTNDPDFHDLRAKILLDAAHDLIRYANETRAPEGFRAGIHEAAVELRRYASNARRQHKKLQDRREEMARASDAKWKAFTGN